MAEVFKSKYTAEQIEEIFDHVNDKNPIIAQNTEDIVQIKAWMEANEFLNIEWVDALPEENISTKTIYMLKDETATEGENLYAEYVYKKDAGWEVIGTVNVGGSTDFVSCTDEEIIEMVNGIWTE